MAKLGTPSGAATTRCAAPPGVARASTPGVRATPPPTYNPHPNTGSTPWPASGNAVQMPHHASTSYPATGTASAHTYSSVTGTDADGASTANAAQSVPPTATTSTTAMTITHLICDHCASHITECARRSKVTQSDGVTASDAPQSLTPAWVGGYPPGVGPYEPGGAGADLPWRLKRTPVRDRWPGDYGLWQRFQ